MFLCCTSSSTSLMEIPRSVRHLYLYYVLLQQYSAVLVKKQKYFKVLKSREMKIPVFSVLLVLTCCSRSLGQPFLKGIANFLSGFKYVPPQTGIFASPSSAAPLYSAPDAVQDNYRSDDESQGVVVFSTSGWLQPSGSSFLYLLGQEAATFSEANYWCVEEGGHLAEIYNEKEMEIVKDLVKRDDQSNFWIGLESPRNKWDTTRRNVDYSNWARSEPNGYSNERCTILWNKRDFAWADWNCGTKKDQQINFKALCQKEHAEETTESRVATGQDVSDFRSDEQCTVNSVSLRGEDWLGRVGEIRTSELCHQQCLETSLCQFWTWREDSNICYLRATDGPITKDSLAVSGTTSAVHGCRHSLDYKQSRVEHCSCRTVSHLVKDGYINPRALPFEEEGSGNVEHFENAHLGRLIIQSACPTGQVLSCTDDDDLTDTDNEVLVIEAKVPVSEPNSNITDCLVNDVRLSVGGLISKVSNVRNSATCHAHCLATPGCAYWTWRGDTSDKKCFLKPSEGRTVRRHGAASGTVLRSLGCDHKIIHRIVEVPETREEVGCFCQRDFSQDLVSSGLIDPRSVPFEQEKEVAPRKLGRIVSFGVKEKKCGFGYKKVCGGQLSNGPKLFDSGLPKFQGLVRERTIPKRELTADNYESGISFPEVK